MAIIKMIKNPPKTKSNFEKADELYYTAGKNST